MRAVRTAALVVAALALAAIRPAGASFVTFESAPVRPLALSPDGGRLFAANTPDARLELFDVSTDGLRHAGSVPVGLEPVAVAARTADEVWVVNHLSDSVSVVRLDGDAPRIARTLLVGDEPRDVVFAGGRAFVTTAHRGQNHPSATSPAEPGVGRADVWVFDVAGEATTPVGIVTLFGDTPRALAVAPDGSAVYAAIFRSGNQTTTVHEGAVCDGGPAAGPCALGPGGLPGPTTNLQGISGPETGLIVAFDRDAQHWRDPLGRVWDDAVRFTLPDRDVFRIDAATLAVTAEWAHVGTILYGMVANPVTGAVYVANTEARNDVRFEGGAATGTTTVRGHMHESRVTILRDGEPALPRRLNPHIDYAVSPSPPGVRERSVALPTAVAIDAAGTTLWIAAFGSGVLAAVDTAALEAGTFTPDVADHVALTGGGPSGVVLDEARGRLYALTRFDNAVSVVDLATRRETAHLPLFDAEPADVVAGRPVLYDARTTSGNGENACASCHVGADVDDLAWDLGNPDALALDNPNPIHFGDAQAFHPLKGPMATQTLRGMAKNGPMHWRGDRTGGLLDDGDPLDARQALDTFNAAFDSLLGLGQPMDPDGMRRLADFTLQIVPPPNPYRALDGSLTPEEQAGRDLFVGRPTDQAGFNCAGCHALAPRDGAFGADGQSALQVGPQLMKIPHLRNLYTKVGMFGVPPIPGLGGDATSRGPQIRGFGFTHDASVDTIERFLGGSSFTLSEVERRQLEAFLLAFDSDLAPSVGQQVTLPSGGPDRWALLRARAEAGDCDAVARGVVAGEARGWLGVAGGLFVADRRAEAPLDDATLRALAGVAGQELTLTCVPPGSGPRLAIDRDEDGFLDRDELDAGTDPADPASHPAGDPLPLARIPIRTSALVLRGTDPVKTMVFVAKTTKDADGHRIVLPPSDGAFDPTRHGAVLRVYNAGFTADAAVIALPASGWRRAGSAKKPKGWRFRGGDVVQRVLLGRDVLRVRARRLPYSLDEPAQGRVALRLSTGLLTDGGWCTAAPARPRGPQQSTAKSDKPGRFVAKPQSPPPAPCPTEP